MATGDTDNESLPGKEIERRFENDVDIYEEDGAETYVEPEGDVLEQVEVTLVDGTWSFECFSPEGAAFHGDLKGHLRNIDSIKIEYNASDELLLDKWKVESQETMRKVYDSGICSNGPLTELDAFIASMPKQYFVLFAEWLNRALKRQPRESDQSEEKVKFEDLVSYLKVECILRLYGISASTGVSMPQDYNMQGLIGPHARIRSYLRLADIPYSKQPGPDGQHNSPRSVDPIIKELESACNKHWTSLFFTPGTTCIALDDDKLPMSSLKWELYGIRLIPTKTRKKKPVVHVVASVSTGFLIQMNLELLDFKLSGAIGATIDNLVGSSTSATAAQLVAFIDRGYFQLAKVQNEDRRTNIVQLLCSKGVKFLGTAKDTSSFPFTEITAKNDTTQANVANGKASITVRGTRSAFSASNRSSGVTAMMMRQGQGKMRVARLITNESSFCTNVWVYETSSGRDPTCPGRVTRQHHRGAPQPISAQVYNTLGTKKRASLAREEFESRVYQMTMSQRSQDWFLARLFRSSSTITHLSMNCTESVFLNTPELKNLHTKVKKIAQLEPTKAISFANAKYVGDDDFAPVEAETEVQTQGDVFVETSSRGRGDRTKPAYWMNNRSVDALIRIVQEEAKVDLPIDRSKQSLAKVLASLEESTPGISRQWNTQNKESLDTSQSSSSSSQALTSVLESDSESDEGDAEDPQVAFLKVMMKRWFVKPLSMGGEAGAPLRIGSLNEEAIAGRLPKFVSTVTDKSFEILWLREYGLLVNRKVPYAADSPDRVCALTKTRDTGEQEFFALAALELKTKTSLTTIKDARERAQLEGKWVTCQAGTAEMKRAIPDPSYRTQVVHHAAVLGLSYTLLVFASPTELLQAVLVEISETQRKDWLKFLELLQNKYMNFAYGPNLGSIPRLGADRKDVYGYAREHHTVDQYLGLWRAHADDVSEHGTPPTAQRILTKMVSSWNKFMGNIDIARKVMKGSKPVYRGLNPTGLVWMTFFDYALYNAFRLWQTSQLLHNGESFRTFKALVDARRKLATYDDFLSNLYRSLSAPAYDSRIPGLWQIINGGRFAGMCDGSAPAPSSALQPPQEVSADASAQKKRRNIARDLVSDIELKLDLNKTRLNAALQHTPLSTPHQRNYCLMCCVACKRNKPHKHGPSGKIKRSHRECRKVCSACKVSLCKDCWEDFHTKEKLQLPPCELAKMD